MASDVRSSAQAARLPWSGLLALFCAGFLGIMSETLPAGLLPEMSADLHLPEAVVGQVTTVYAVGTALTAIPLQALLAGAGRRRLLVGALTAFAAASAALAVVPGFPAILLVRAVAGGAAGVIWSNIGGVAGRIGPAGREHRAVAVALAGTPVALSLGLPLGTLLGEAVGWRATFGAVALASLGAAAWARVALPALPGERSAGGVRLGALLRAPGVSVVVLVTAGFITAHNLLYTYIGPIAVSAGEGGEVEWVLAAFGLAAVVSIWATGVLVEPHHRRLVIAAGGLVLISAAVLAAAQESPVALFAGVVLWGLGFGGSATLFLTAATRAAGSDAVQSIVVTTFNVSIAAGGAVGGLLLSGAGVESIPWSVVLIMLPVVAVILVARFSAFPRW